MQPPYNRNRPCQQKQLLALPGMFLHFPLLPPGHFFLRACSDDPRISEAASPANS